MNIHHKEGFKNPTNSSNETSLNILKSILEHLLRHYLQLLSFTGSRAFDQHDSFVGKHKLKETLFEHLPLAEMERVGFGRQQVSQLLNKMFKDGLASALIEEASIRKMRRKEELVKKDLSSTYNRELLSSANLESHEILSGHTGATCGDETFPTLSLDRILLGPLTPRITPAGSDFHTSARSERGCSSIDSVVTPVVLGKVQNKSRLHRAIRREGMTTTTTSSVSSSPELGYSPRIASYAVAHVPSVSRPSVLSTPLPFLVQHEFSKYLQWTLESASYFFAQYNIKEIFERRPHLASCPQVQELTEWSKIIAAAMRGHLSSESVTLITALEKTSQIRHAAVHRNTFDAEKAWGYLEVADAVLRLFKKISWPRGVAHGIQVFEQHLFGVSILKREIQNVLDSPVNTRHSALTSLWAELVTLKKHSDTYRGVLRLKKDEESLDERREEQILSDLDLDMRSEPQFGVSDNDQSITKSRTGGLLDLNRKGKQVPSLKLDLCQPVWGRYRLEGRMEDGGCARTEGESLSRRN